MFYVVDGSNAAGRVAGAPRDDEAKRELVTLLASIVRVKRGRAICVFDGPPPPSFALVYGSLQVRFAAPKSGDDVIVGIVSGMSQPITVVTDDQALAARVRGRRVSVVGPREFLAAAPASEGASDDTDWSDYFSDPNNRNV